MGEATIAISAASALGYFALAVWRVSIERTRRDTWVLALGFIGLSFSSLCGFRHDGLTIFSEAVRNAVWMVYLLIVVRKDAIALPQRWITSLPILLLAVALGQAFASLLLPNGQPDNWSSSAILGATVVFDIGALVLVHSLYSAAHRDAAGFRLVLIALAVVWSYELNFYAVLLLGFERSGMLSDGRGILALLLCPVFAVAARRKERWSVRLSRAATLQSLSLIAIGSYFVFVSIIASAKPARQAVNGLTAQIVLLFVVSIFGVVLLASRQLRGTIKNFVSQHFFEHRYDYRAEWLRFNATVTSGSITGLDPDQCAVKVLVDLMGATGGVMYIHSEREQFARAALFGSPSRTTMAEEVSLSEGLFAKVQKSAFVMISPRYTDQGSLFEFPKGMPIDGSVWLVVPLIRMEMLIGLIALGKPQVPRDLDWEDFALLKVLSQQIATYVTDSRLQAQVEEARQFEEFNRRFAFIVHDIKNIVSQLSLVAANVTEYGANPKFQADMASTLENSVAKMKVLLGRLSLAETHVNESPEVIDPTGLIAGLVEARRFQHPVLMSECKPMRVLGNRAALGMAIEHIVQNAIEASGATDQVLLTTNALNGRGTIAVMDTGRGMSAEFVRNHLFKPFASTKPSGFGIGAGEARTLIRQMGGEIEVRSLEGVGTTFIITLPLALDA